MDRSAILIALTVYTSVLPATAPAGELTDQQFEAIRGILAQAGVPD